MKNAAAPTPDNVHKLLKTYRDRLYFLELNKARSGYNTPPEILMEIKEIRDETIPDLISYIEDIPSENKEIDEHASREIQRIGHRVDELTAAYSGISFINREVELQAITNPLPIANPYLIIDAPARYGKTFLLKQAKIMLKKDGWLISLVDFKESPSATDNEISFLKAVIEGLPDDIKIPLINYDNGYPVSEIIGWLSRKPVALLLDSVEIIRSSEFSKWIRDNFIYELEKTTRDLVGGGFRCVIAGRYITHIWREPNSKFGLGRSELFKEAIRLSPFTFEVILDTIKDLERDRRQNNGDRISLSREAMERIARGVLALSGGHPDCLVSLLLEINFKHGLSPNPSYFDDNYEDLFKRHVEPACKAILRDVPDSVRNIYPFLCYFRCYNERIIYSVLEWASVNKLLNGKEVSDVFVREIIQLLTQQGLINWDNSKHFFVDNNVRRIITFQQKINKEHPIHELNQIALDLYNQWIHSPLLNDSTRYQTLIIEHLYHLSEQLARLNVTFEESIFRLNEELMQNIGSFETKFFETMDPSEWKERLADLLTDLETDEDILSNVLRFGERRSIDVLYEPLRVKISDLERDLDT